MNNIKATKIELEKLAEQVEKEIQEQLEKANRICEINSKKVLEAFQDCLVYTSPSPRD